jgi:hypothetical protein
MLTLIIGIMSSFTEAHVCDAMKGGLRGGLPLLDAVYYHLLLSLSPYISPYLLISLSPYLLISLSPHISIFSYTYLLISLPLHPYLLISLSLTGLRFNRERAVEKRDEGEW